MTKSDIFPEIETTAKDILDHSNSIYSAGDLRLRLISIITGSSLLCVIMDETVDSFLVALPCKLMSYAEKRVVEPYVPTKFMRVMKTGSLTVIPCFGEFEAFYIKWLLDIGVKAYPEVINEQYVTRLKERFEKIKKDVSILKEEIENISKDGEEKEPTSISLPASKYTH